MNVNLEHLRLCFDSNITRNILANISKNSDKDILY